LKSYEELSKIFARVHECLMIINHFPECKLKFEAYEEYAKLMNNLDAETEMKVYDFIERSIRFNSQNR